MGGDAGDFEELMGMSPEAGFTRPHATCRDRPPSSLAPPGARPEFNAARFAAPPVPAFRQHSPWNAPSQMILQDN